MNKYVPGGKGRGPAVKHKGGVSGHSRSPTAGSKAARARLSSAPAHPVGSAGPAVHTPRAAGPEARGHLLAGLATVLRPVHGPPNLGGLGQASLTPPHPRRAQPCCRCRRRRRSRRWTPPNLPLPSLQPARHRPASRDCPHRPADWRGVAPRATRITRLDRLEQAPPAERQRFGTAPFGPPAGLSSPSGACFQRQIPESKRRSQSVRPVGPVGHVTALQAPERPEVAGSPTWRVRTAPCSAAGPGGGA